MSNTDYRVCLHVGQRPQIGASAYLEIAPAGGSVDEIVAAVNATGVTAADLRARTLVSFDCEPAMALRVYSTLIGFAGRRVDFAVDGTLVETHALHTAISSVAEATEKPAEPAEYVQVSTSTRDDVVNVQPGVEMSPDDILAVRYGRRVRIATDGMDTMTALTVLVTVAGLRSRNGADRLPIMIENPSSDLFVGEGDERTAVGTEGENYRRAGNELRRSSRIDDRTTVADREQDTPRLEALRKAAAVKIEHTLTLLGSMQHPETGLWRCPRPTRHRNGDANPSLKVNEEGLVRCFRCDAARILNR